jgi:hypothetical protein
MKYISPHLLFYYFISPQHPNLKYTTCIFRRGRKYNERDMEHTRRDENCITEVGRKQRRLLRKSSGENKSKVFAMQN